MPFCDLNSTRYDLSIPFIYNGWKYATDGRVAVRVRTEKPNDPVSDNRKLPTAQIEQIFNSFPPDGYMTCEFPTVKRLCGDDWCAKCNSIGWVKTKYDPIEDSDEIACDICNPTFDCKTKVIYGVKFTLHWWAMLENLPGIKIAGEIQPRTKAFFVFDAGTAGQGQAVLMPCEDR